MIEIALREVEKFYGANHILKGVSFEIAQGQRLGLLGRNGTGKTTLFKIIAGIEKADTGSVMIRKEAVIGILDQMPLFPETYTVSDVLYSAFDKLMKIRSQMTELEKLMSDGCTTDDTIHRYGRLQQAFEAGSGYLMEQEIEKICLGLKIDRSMLKKTFNSLSGGEKTRITLGRLLLQKPDIILLDEPTNHLDLSSIEWLEDFLSAYPGTAVIISHDRYFLGRAVNRIVELVNGRAEVYEGGYSFYIKEKEARFISLLEKYQQEQKKIKQLEAAAKRMHEWAKAADNPAMHKRAFSIEKRIERMDKTDKPVIEQQINTPFSEKQFSSKDVITAQGLVKAYNGVNVLDCTDFRVQKGERVAILGSNGCGKSTLIKIITGELEADQGTAKTGESINHAYLPQEVCFENPSLPVLDTVRASLGISEGSARGLLAKYNFKGEDVCKIVNNLSGGEKSRLRLCILMQEDVNLLLLDEPTNHLDIDSREWLEDALSEFGGTLVFVSHDRYFINRFATRISEVKNGKIFDYYGNYEYYKVKKHEAGDCNGGNSPVRNPPAGKETPGFGKEVLSAEKARDTDIRKLEASITGLENILKGISEEMEQNSNDYEKLNSLFRKKTELEAEIEELYNQWASIV